MRSLNNKSLWPFKKSPRSFCGFGGCGQPSARSSSESPALLNLTPSKSPQQFRKQDECTPSSDLDEKHASPEVSTPQMRLSVLGPEPPPKDTEWRRTRQQRRQGGLVQLDRPLPCTPAPSQDSHSCYSSPPDTSSTDGERVETSGLERLASFLRFYRPANGQQGLSSDTPDVSKVRLSLFVSPPPMLISPLAAYCAAPAQRVGQLEWSEFEMANALD